MSRYHEYVAPDPYSELSAIPSHVEFFRSKSGCDTSWSDVLDSVCSSFVALPEDKLDGLYIHIPALDFVVDGGDVERGDSAYRRVSSGCRGLIIVSSPHRSDVSTGVALSPLSQGGRFMRQVLDSAGLYEKLAITHACRFCLPDHVKQYATAHYKSNIVYCLADILRLRPKAVFVSGAQSVKHLFGVALKAVRGSICMLRVKDFVVPVIPSVNHTAFLAAQDDLSIFMKELKLFASLLAYDGDLSVRISKSRYAAVSRLSGYRLLTTPSEVSDLCQQLIADESVHMIAIDTEFGNDVAQDRKSYLLTVQLAWGPGKAACIVFRAYGSYPSGLSGARQLASEPGGRVMSEAEESEAMSHLKRLLEHPRMTLIGHHLRADVRQLERYGIQLENKIDTSIDTMLVHYVLYGDIESHGLDILVQKYLPMFGAYWCDVESWLDKHGRSSMLRFGYRNIPFEILAPYALYDVDATWQLAQKLMDELRACPELYDVYWRFTAPTSQHLYDVEKNGVLVDESVRKAMREYYSPMLDYCVERMRKILDWPEFMPSSKVHITYVLFGKHVYKNREKAEAIVPEHVKNRIFDFKPLYNTDKYPRDWADIAVSGEEHLHTPSTEYEAIKILLSLNPNNEFLTLYKHYSVLSKFLTTYLAETKFNEFGEPEEGASFAQNIREDGRVVTRLSQLTATGRYTSSHANLQVSPKKQEAALLAAAVYITYGIDSVEEYKRRSKLPADHPEFIAPLPEYNFKRCMVAPPGYVLIEADFKNAELCIWAYLSGDANLIRLVRSGRDLHSEVACAALHLPPLKDMQKVIDELERGNKTPYKEWNARVKHEYEAQRTAAKAVNFGIMYGRGAVALSRALTSDGSPMSPEQCQEIIDSFAMQFPTAWQWLQDGAAFAVEHGYIANPFGARRYFGDTSLMGSAELSAVRREAMNARIQGTVAYLLSQAGILLYKAKHQSPKWCDVDFKILLPIHDAFLFEVRKDHVDRFLKLLTLCMSTMNRIPNCPYVLDIDVSVMQSWGEKA